MKKHFYIIAFALLPATLLAQPVLSTGITPAPGTVIPFVTLTQSIDMSISGEGVTWDFSSLSGGQSADAEIVDPSTDSDASAFPNATHVLRGLGPKKFYLMDGTGWYVLGIGMSGFTLECTNSLREVKIPMQYGSSSVDQINCSFSFQGLDFNRTGFVETSYDGWGTIILPNGSLENVIRIKFQELSTDLASFQGFPVSNQNDNVTYYFFAPGKAFPVFIYNETNASTFPISVTTVQYNSTPNIGIDAQPEASLLLNNPVTNGVLKLNLPGSLPVAQWKITDLTGRTLQESATALSPGTLELPLELRESGIYFLHLYGPAGNQTLRFLIP